MTQRRPLTDAEFREKMEALLPRTASTTLPRTTIHVDVPRVDGETVTIVLTPAEALRLVARLAAAVATTMPPPADVGTA